jgi:hypothetical protein
MPPELGHADVERAQTLAERGESEIIWRASILGHDGASP